MCNLLELPNRQMNLCCLAMWPNIPGSVNFRHGNIDASAGIITAASAPFEKNDRTQSTASPFAFDVSMEFKADRLDFQPELANSLFNGNKLQPKALQVLPCIKT